MTLTEQRTLRELRLSGIAATLNTRVMQAQQGDTDELSTASAASNIRSPLLTGWPIPPLTRSRMFGNSSKTVRMLGTCLCLDPLQTFVIFQSGM